ncbi:venom carboxylesterase-6-like [Zerene cesonia]|uniref:venom carboxylesterase-6-like n=1 Tax=Zerene cesonia TaxID=33412 RepID=UPI0018E50555|nr:venom carboxylesterase-6-like [Zerene cesonia]
MLVLAILCCVLAANASQDGEAKQSPVARSPSGEFLGIYNVTRRGRRYEAYRGIKYAEPPVGDLRFQPPVPILKYEVPVDATKNGPACPQPSSPGYFVDEDCLTINVYTPTEQERKKPLPVIFFIHPGGFYSMTGRSDLFAPDYLLDRDVVVVTINYRLATLGFLSTGDKLAPGNNGLKDQVAALKWVQRNIAAFGGNPQLVTIAGCSSGSTSVMLHMISPMSKGLFHRAISLSGSPVRKVRSPTHLYPLAVRQAELVGCPRNSSGDIVNCLRTVPWKDLGLSLNRFYEFGYDPLTLWTPVVEADYGQERFLPIDPIDAIREGRMHPVPYIISRTKDEFFWKAFTILRNETLLRRMNENWEDIAPISFLLPRDNSSNATRRLRHEYCLDDMRNDSDTAHNLGRLYLDSIESFPIYRLTKLMSIHSTAPVWSCLFTYIGNNSFYQDPRSKKPVGSAHHDDLLYLFYVAYRFPRIGLQGPDADMVEKMLGIWYNFARYGDPNDRGDTPELYIHWPPTSPIERPYLRIDKQLSIHKNLFGESAGLWEELYPIQY